MRSIPGNGGKEDRLSPMYNGLVNVFLILRQVIALPSRLGKSVDTIDVLRVRSRVQWEGILKKCDFAVNIGDRACKEEACGVTIGTFGLGDSDLRSGVMVQCVKMRNRGPRDDELNSWDCEGKKR